MLSSLRRRAILGPSAWASIARSAFPSSFQSTRPQIDFKQYQYNQFWSKKEDPNEGEKATGKVDSSVTNSNNKPEGSGSGDGNIQKQDGNKSTTPTDKSIFDQYVDPKLLEAPQQVLSSLWTTKEEPKTDDPKKNAKDDKNEKNQEEFFSSIWSLWEKYEMTVFMVGVACIVVYIVFSDDESPKETLVGEQECEAKLLADTTPGTHPGSNHIKRVKMDHRLSIAELVKQGVGHAELEGTLWVCKGPNEFSYPQKVFQQQYWNDEAAYELTPEAAQKLRLATEELHAMCLEAVDIVVASDDLLTLFEIPPNMWDEVRRSWRARERDFLGRFDFMWDGRGEPKLAEYNADTPTILVETAVGQQMWSTLMHQHHPQGFGWTFNALEQQIINALSGFLLQASLTAAATTTATTAATTTTDTNEKAATDTIHFAGVYESVEEREHLRYLAKLARLAGFTTQLVDVAHLDVLMGRLIATKLQTGSTITTQVDTDGYETIDTIFKLYPYEWLAHENVGRELFRESNAVGVTEQVHGVPRTRWIEPAWKLILGNKAILAVLWQRFPGHPNLLPAFFELPDDAIADDSSGYNDQSAEETTAPNTSRGIGYVAKPKFGREGQGIVYGHKYTYASDFVTAAEQQIYSGYTATSTTTSHDNEVYLGYPVYQKYFDTATFSMRHIVIGSWVVGGVPSGFNFREDSTATTQDSSCFVPHYITGTSQQKEFATVYGSSFNAVQRQLYKDLYGIDLTHRPPPGAVGKTGFHYRTGGGGGGSGMGLVRDLYEIKSMKDKEDQEKKEKEERDKKAKEEKEKKDKEEREKKQGKDKDQKDKKDHQAKQDTAAKDSKQDSQDAAQKTKDTSTKATAERFRTKRSQAGGFHTHDSQHPRQSRPTRTTGSSYKAAKASASRGGFGRTG